MKEALEIIKELIETIDWLGGDAYEMDVISKVINRANEFYDKFENQQS